MRTTDRDKLDARLKALESRTEASGGARERLAARLAAYHEVLPPVPAHEARTRLLAGLAGKMGHLAALRRAVERHG